MKPVRSLIDRTACDRTPWAGLSLLLAGLIAFLSTSSTAQEAAPSAEPAAPTAGQAAEDEDEEEAAADEKDEVDPRTVAAEEEARRLRIERQTEFTSTLPTEGGLLSSFAIPEGLLGNRGLRVGRFLLLPAATVGAVYTDNAEAVDDNREDELSASAAAGIRAQTILPRHQLGFDATANTSYSFQDENDDFFDWQLGGDGRLDLTRRSTLAGRVAYSLDTESDSSAEAEGEANDIETINGTVGYGFSGNRVDLQTELGVDRANFSGDGSADRDQTSFRVSQRFAHATTSRLTLFVSPQYTYSTFDEEVADDGESRDAHDASGVVGADLVLRNGYTLSTAVGYARLFFEDSGRDDTDSLIANASLSWQPSALSSVELSASHSLNLTDVDDAAARTDTTLSLGATRQFGTNFALQGTLSSTYADFQDIDREDVDVIANAGLTRRLNDHLFLSLAYQFQQRFSNDDADFYENQALLGLSIVY